MIVTERTSSVTVIVTVSSDCFFAITVTVTAPAVWYQSCLDSHTYDIGREASAVAVCWAVRGRDIGERERERIVL